MPGSPDEWESSFGWLTPMYGIAPTAWLYFAITGAPFPSSPQNICGGVDERLNFTIHEGEIATCRATHSIRLTPGFHAEQGSTFRAYIEEK